MDFSQFEVFTVFIIIFLLLEFFFPRSNFKSNNSANWLVNFGLYIIVMIFRPLAAPILLLFSDIINYQPLALWDSLPTILTLFTSILFIDFFAYWQHRIFHFFTLLWRCHLVHHSDTEMNISTNFRHHPFEFIATSVLTTLFLYLFKLPEFTLIIYFFLSTVIALWHHSDIKNSTLLNKLLQPIFITPEIHRLHHSSNTQERNSNYGMVFSFWDKLFSSYTEPKNTENDIEFGLEYFRSDADKKFINVLLQPKRYGKIQQKSYCKKN